MTVSINVCNLIAEKRYLAYTYKNKQKIHILNKYMSMAANKNYGVIENKKYLHIKIKLPFYHGISFFMLKNNDRRSIWV